MRSQIDRLGVERAKLAVRGGGEDGHDGVDNLSVDDVLLCASVPLDIRFGLILAKDDVDVSSVCVSSICDVYVDREHLSNRSFSVWSHYAL